MNVDMDDNGTITDREAELAAKLIELENIDQKADQQRRMAWVAMLSMLILTALLFLPILPDSRVEILADVISMFYVANAGIIAAFFGANAYMTMNKTNTNHYDRGM